ncbi:hypothetical protein ACHAQH_000476 [Verticillium albo-atrum]
MSRTVPLTKEFTDVTSTDDVRKKLQNMLSATEALKPQDRKQDSRVSRMSHKLVNKASRAWGRIQGKKPASEATARHKISAPLELGGGLELQGGFYATGQAWRLALPKKFKGPSSDGNPVDELEQSSTDHSVTSNPFADPSVPYSPKTPVQQIGSTEPVALTPTNPFDSDPDFSADLNAVLTDRPVGASTPRIRRKEGSSTSLDTPSLRQQVAQSQVGNKATPILPRPDAINTEGYDVLFTEAGRPACEKFTTSKKYPSPDKDSLAQLAQQLREMGIQEPPPGRVQRDELSNSFVGSRPFPRTLAPRDKNLPLGRLLVKSEANVCTPSSLRKSRIPRPAGSTRSEARFGLMTHPLDPGAMESDELA